MADNCWQLDDLPHDVKCPPSGKRLLAKYPNGDSLEVRFRELDERVLSRLQLNPESRKLIHLPITTVSVSLTRPGHEIHIGTKLAASGLKAFQNLMVGCWSVLDLG